jgi:hypothetical protein
MARPERAPLAMRCAAQRVTKVRTKADVPGPGLGRYMATSQE